MPMLTVTCWGEKNLGKGNNEEWSQLKKTTDGRYLRKSLGFKLNFLKEDGLMLIVKQLLGKRMKHINPEKENLTEQDIPVIDY
jgi:hypothetical protein